MVFNATFNNISEKTYRKSLTNYDEGRGDRMVFGFTTTYEISAYYH
jgi:hypothetical protein